MQYTANIHWQRDVNTDFNAKSYDRTHDIHFGGGTACKASSAKEFLGKAELPNPEELFTAAISSCFMLTFLYLVATKNLVLDEYDANAIGTLAKNAEGKMAITQVVIKPKFRFHGQQPDANMLQELLKKAHEQCFISSSVKSTVLIELE